MGGGNKDKLSTESYKGVRDFYPKEMFVQNYIFEVMRETAESFGFEEYSASILEPSDLYEAKTGEEIVAKQTYTFKDRGGRSVTLRPEMTPTVARMVAAKRRDLAFPLRWYSIPNIFRYERPQRGRLREHWQLNVDLFGLDSTEADIEVISLAHKIMRNFGAHEEQFNIHINSKRLIDRIFGHFSLSEDEIRSVSKLIDKRNKMPSDEFYGKLKNTLGDKSEVSDTLMAIVGENKVENLPESIQDSDELREVEKIMKELGKLGIGNTVFDFSIVRGFDYYTGVIFEIFDTGGENNRSLFGGGRYDDLMKVFGESRVPAVGFGMGDVTMRDFLTTYDLLPAYAPNVDLYLCTLDPEVEGAAQELGARLRESGVNVAIDFSGRRVGDQIKVANKKGIPFALFFGKNEMKSKTFKIKNLKSGKEADVKESDVAEFIRQEYA